MFMKCLKNIGLLFTPLIGGSVVGFIIKNHIDYNALIKPPISPPSIIFPIAWSSIYLLLGISYYLIKKDEIRTNNRLKVLYYTQLIVNYLWSIIFFIFKFRLLASAWIIILDILVFLMIKEIRHEKRVSAYLNIPYLIWILFATYLTIGIYLLN